MIVTYTAISGKVVKKAVCVGEVSLLVVLVPLTAAKYDFVIPSLEHPHPAESQESTPQSQYAVDHVAAVSTSGDVTIVVPTAKLTTTTFPPTVTIS